MLALRLKRTGRKKISHYRVIAQEHRFQPTSGKVAAYLGSYNPHTKEAQLDVEQIEMYLSNGARPSDAAAKLFKAQGIKLPEWVSIHQHPDKKKQKPAEEADETAEVADAADEPAESDKDDDKRQAEDKPVEEADKSNDTSEDTEDEDDKDESSNEDKDNKDNKDDKDEEKTDKK